MDEMKKDTNLLNGKGETEDVYWITVNGAHIPVEEGETKKEAIAKIATRTEKINTVTTTADIFLVLFTKSNLRKA